ncbi:sodium-coupled monocarboxylate transporter 1 [Acyrthosiphon pisum]|uniref:Sodium/solute symporter n=1 Tax=Acyrthosiphon pisum TaxID=7029 RepID=A0A8R1W1C8_ACYPI|nr:sodium-coupled monocarboxylate transporter 1 [Acyrthosiphon pisum]|eukprot:XP_001948596.2 PREDICTED: sodium-coupled monocarboxylate transporter 1 [Acyrthosiphon pisum]
MLGLSVVIGLYYGCVSKQNTVADYLLGGKHMSVFPITMSLVASHISGITLLGVPSEIYSNGTQYLIVGVVNNIVVIFTVIYIYLPVFYDLQLTSVYEYLGLRFDSNIRGLSSLIFAVNLLLYIPVVIYIPALAFNQVTGLDVHLITVIICVICIFYTTIGGLKAVVWTDAIQSIFTAVSIMIVIILGAIQVGGFGSMIRANQEGGRIEFFKMDPNPFLRNTFWTVSIGTTFQWLASLGIHPGAVQRFVALPTYAKARKAAIFFVLGMAVVKLLTGAIGMLIYAKYKDCDPLMANYIDNDRKLVPYYVMDVASKFPGLTGLFVSGIVSAALSTMSAQINTVSGTIYEDFIVKMMGITVTDLTASVIMKCIAVISGFICVILVFVVEKMNGILQMSISLGSVTSGALLSVFTLGVCFPWANSRGAMCGMLTSLAVMAWIVAGAQFAIYDKELMFVEKDVSISGCPANTTFRNHTDFSGLSRLNEDVYASPNVWKIYTVSYMHYSTIGTLVGIAVGLAVSLMFPTDENVDPRLLTPCIRNFVYPKYMTETVLNGKTTHNKTDTYEAVSQETKL